MKTRRPPPAPSADWAYFLDVDGTLLDIAETPGRRPGRCGAARTDRPAAPREQRRGGADQRPRASPISTSRLGMLRLPHGRAARPGAARRRRPAVAARAAAAKPSARIKKALAPLLERHPGLLLEDKGLTLALHYRQAPAAGRLCAPADGATGGRRRRRAGAAEGQAGGRDQAGRHRQGHAPSASILPSRPSSGGARCSSATTLNDEHGFAEINRADGLSIKVGRAGPARRYRLPDVAAVRHWLSGALKEAT